MNLSEPNPDSELIQSGYRYALSLTHHHYDAEDLVQQSWLKLTHRYGSVKNRSMLFSTIRNQFYDQCRRGKIVVFEPIDDHDEPSTAGHQPACDDMDTMLAGLRSEEREALYLNVVEGYTAQEIAKKTGSPRGTILSLIHRAKRKLASTFGLKEATDQARNNKETES